MRNKGIHGLDGRCIFLMPQVLKDDETRIYIPSQKIEAWWTIAESLSQAGFYVVNTFIKVSTKSTRRDKETLDMDFIGLKKESWEY